MSTIRAIRTEADYKAALARVDALMDAEVGTPEGEELDVLTDLMELYEARHVPMGYPTALAALRFRMEQAGLSPRDLIPVYWEAGRKVSEFLSGKRPLTMQMARALSLNLGIPADVLLQQPGGELPARSMGSTGSGSRSLRWRSAAGSRSGRTSWRTPKKSCSRSSSGQAARTLFRRRSTVRTTMRVPTRRRSLCTKGLVLGGAGARQCVRLPGT